MSTKTRNHAILKLWHISMQFSDTPQEMGADAERIFSQASRRRVWWVTGTEAGGGSPLAAILRRAAIKYNFRFYHAQGQDCWIAVNNDFIEGDWQVDPGEVVVDGVARRFTDKKVPVVAFTAKSIGPVGVGVGHYLTKGRPDARTPEYRQNLAHNEDIAECIGERAREYGKGRSKFFYAGDQNIVDRMNDTFLGLAKMLTCWDETGKYPNTGHGNIDVIASYLLDGLVRCLSARVYTDKQFPLHTDHILVEAIYDVEY